MLENIKTAESFCGKFSIPGEIISFEPFGSGIINDTYLLTVKSDSKKRYIAQTVNLGVFKNAEAMMNNIISVTHHVRDKIIKTGSNPERLVLQFLETEDNIPYFYDSEGNFWRGYEFIENSVTYDTSDNIEVLKNAGTAFGRFQIQLSDFDASKIVEIIPDFHNTRARYSAFKEAVSNNTADRAEEIKSEIDYLLSAEDKACKLVDMLKTGDLPLRVTHNDTKCNNVLFDTVTNEPIAVIDLDTVMPGIASYDFGDSVRFIANTAAEDEPDISKVSFDLDLFKAYAEGFIGEVAAAWEEKEILTLADAVFSITAELATRFLADYLNGDTYFKINYPQHNLVRTRCQIALLKDIEKKENAMRDIILKIYNGKKA